MVQERMSCHPCVAAWVSGRYAPLITPEDVYLVPGYPVS